MKKLLIYLVPVALMAAQASAAPPSGWAGIVAGDLGAATGATDDTHLVLVQYRRGGGGAYRGNVNRASVNRSSFNSANFHRDVSVNRNVNVNRNVSVNRGYYGGGSYGPNWGGVAAGVAVGAGVTAMATSAAAASSAYYPPPPPYSYYGYGY
jgi:hypothetical protein